MTFKIVGLHGNNHFEGKEYKTLAAARTALTRCLFGRGWWDSGQREVNFSIEEIKSEQSNVGKPDE